jgi:hypothetical protein
MSTMITPSLAVLLPAATAAFAPPRTAHEAKATAAKLNEAARRLREQNERDAQRRRQEHEATAARTKQLSGHRPTSTRTTAAKTPSLSTSAVYGTYNNRAHAHALHRARAVLPETRSELCSEACYLPGTCDGATCWAGRLEEKAAAGRNPLNPRDVYAAVNRRHDRSAGLVGPR